MIVGQVVNTKGKRFFMVAWKGTTQGDLVGVDEFGAKFPEHVIGFYENRRGWAESSSVSENGPNTSHRSRLTEVSSND